MHNEITLQDRPALLAQNTKQLLIDGKWLPSVSGKTLDTFNPATGEVLAHLAEADAADVDLAVKAARRAFEGKWSKWTPYDRQRLLMRVHDLVDKHFDELAMLETLDMGSPLSRTLGMRRYVSQVILYYATQTVNVAGETLPNSRRSGRGVFCRADGFFKCDQQHDHSPRRDFRTGRVCHSFRRCRGGAEACE